jgi:hypothetical protein
MNLNVSILPEAIYVNCDTTFYKDSSTHCFNLKGGRKEKASITTLFFWKRRLGWTIQPNVYMKFHFKHWSIEGQACSQIWLARIRKCR